MKPSRAKVVQFYECAKCEWNGLAEGVLKPVRIPVPNVPQVEFTDDADGRIVCVIAFHRGDVGQAERLLDWCDEIGGCRPHDCLLVPACQTLDTDVERIRSLAASVFREVVVIRTPSQLPDETHPLGANWSFATALVAMKGSRRPWLFCEPDSVPCARGWLQALDVEYRRAGRRFMGTVHRSGMNGFANHVNGTAIYAAGVADELLQNSLSSVPFDVAIGHIVAPETHQPPTFGAWFPEFAPAYWPGVIERDVIKGGMVYSHRDKSGTAIAELRKRFRVEHVYAYFDRVPEIDAEHELQLLDLWRDSWEQAGFKTRVLGIADARRHPRFTELLRITRQRPSVCPEAYKVAVAIRWAAMASVMDGPGIMLDYDVMNTGRYTPRDTTRYERTTIIAKAVCLSAGYVPTREASDEFVDVLCRPCDPMRLPDGQLEQKDQEICAALWPTLGWDLDTVSECVYGEGTGGEKMIHFPTRVVPEGMRKVDMVRFWLANHVLPNRQPHDARRRAPRGGGDLGDV